MISMERSVTDASSKQADLIVSLASGLLLLLLLLLQ